MSRRKGFDQKTAGESVSEKFRAALHGVHHNKEAHECVHYLRGIADMESFRRFNSDNDRFLESTKKTALDILCKHTLKAFKTGNADFFRDMADELEKSVNHPNPVIVLFGGRIVQAWADGKPIPALRELIREARAKGIMASKKTFQRAYHIFGEKGKPGRPRK